MNKSQILIIAFLISLSICALASTQVKAAVLSITVSPEGPITMDVGQVQVFTATPNGGSGPMSIQWNLDGSQVASESPNYSFSATSTGPHLITVFVTDFTDDAQDSVFVTVAAPPTVSIAPNGPIKMNVGQVQVFTAVPIGGSGTIKYQWYLGGSVVSGATGSTYSFSPAAAGSHLVACKVTDSASSPVTSPFSNAVSVVVNPALVAPTVSASATTVNRGQSSSLSSSAVSTGSAPYSYQWFSRAPGGSFSPISGATSNSYSFVTSGSTATGSWSFQLQVTDAVSAVVTSSAVSVVVNPALVAPTVSASATTVNRGQSSSLSSSAVSTGSAPYSYQWFSRAPGGSFSPISGATSNSYSFVTSGSTATGSWSFQLQVTDAVSAVVTSSAVSVVVNPALVAPTVSASLGTIVQGQSSVLSSSAVSTGSAPYSYQWFSRAPGGSFSPISGATSNSYSFVTSGSTATGSWSFQLQVTDAVSAVVTSSAVSVVVNPALVAPTVSASATTVNRGQSSSLSSSAVSTGSAPYSYQWFSRAPGGSFSPISGATSNSYSFVTSGSTATGSWSFQLQVTDAVSAVVTSSAVSVVVNPALVAPTVSASATTVNRGQSSSLSSSAVSTGSAPYSYQWFSRAPGGSFSPISGATSNSYSFVTSGSTATGSWSFQLQVTDAVSAVVTSSAVSVVVNPALVAPTVSASLGTIVQGQSSVLSSSAVSTGSAPYSYQWFSRAPGGSFSPISGATSSSYSFATSISTATGSWSFQLQVTDAASAVVNSSEFSIIVNIPPLDHFVFVYIGPQTAGMSFSITIIAKDASNNTLTNFVGTNTLDVSTGTISPSSTGAFSKGVWTGSVIVTGANSGVTIFTVGSSMTGTSNSFTVNSGALNNFTFSPINSPQTVGSSFNIIVTAYDVYGNIVTGYVGKPILTVSAGSISPLNMNSFVNGIGSTSVTLTDVGSGITITATDSIYSGTSNSFTVTKVDTPTPSPTTNLIPTPTPRSTGTPQATSNPTTKPSPSSTPFETTIIAKTDNGTTVNFGISGNITSSQMSNVTITTNQSALLITVTFTLTGQDGTTGFSNLTIPKNNVEYGITPEIFIDNQRASIQGYTQDAYNYYIWYSTEFSTHQVKIQFALPSVFQETSFASMLAVGLTVPEIILIYAVIAVRRLKRKPDNT